MGIQAVLLDLDDTLWPAGPLIMRAELALYQWMSVHVPKVVKRYSMEQLRLQRKALAKTHPKFSYDLWSLRHTMLLQVFKKCGENPDLADQAMQVFADARNQVELFDDVLPAFEALQGKVMMGTISNGFANLQAIGLAHHFQISLAAHSFGCAKPDSRIFHSACDALNLAPQQVLYVGDDLFLDVYGARKAGLKAVWLNRNRISPADTAHKHIEPDATITSLSEITQFL